MKKEKTNANQAEKISLAKRLSKGSSRRGTYAAAVSAVVIAIVVFLNLIIGQLPSNVLEFDISDNSLYDISYTSEQLLSALDTDVKVTILAESGNADERILKFLDDYAALSPHVTVTTIDPVLYPSILEKYDTVENTVVVENEDSGTYTVINLYGFEGYGDAMLLYDYSYYSNYGSYYETSFDAEGLLTSAVSYVTNETSSLVYTLEGHGESSFGASLTELFTKNHIDTDSVDLLMDGGVPEDCELLICYNPTEDLADDELTILQEYLKDGGNVMLLMDSTDLVNFNALMSEYGLSMQEGNVGDMARYFQYYSSPFFFAPVLSTSDAVTSSIGDDVLTALQYPRGMLESDPARDTITVSAFMTTSESGRCYVDEANYSDGTYILGADATETIDEDADIASRLTVISAVSLIDEDLVSQATNLSNLDVFMNAVVANFDDVQNISISAKSMELTHNTLSMTGFWSLLLIIVLPLAVLIGGLLYWLRRRKS